MRQGELPVGRKSGSAFETRPIIRLDVGDRLPPVAWCDGAGNRVCLSEDRFGGRPTVLFLGLAPQTAEDRERIHRFAERRDVFRAVGAQVFIVLAGAEATENPSIGSPTSGETDSGVPVVLDAGGAMRLALGLSLDPRARSDWPVVLLDECHRIERVIPGRSGVDPADDALAHCATRRERTTPCLRTPPVLVLPNLITGEHCRRLIATWGAGHCYPGGVASAAAGHRVESQIKTREDLALPDRSAEAQELFAIFRRRLFPEVARVFHYSISRAETLRLGCYDASAGGAFKAHRDDSTPAVQHRAFAMSLFLNSGAYRGGTLRFPEYGQEDYNPPPGSAVVFSCSLLHEVAPVTEGRRFGLFGFFHGEAEEAQRQANNAPYQYIRVDREEAPSSYLPLGQNPLFRP